MKSKKYVQLIPCPFCGEVPEGSHEPYGPWFVHHDCDAMMSMVQEPTRAKANARWNTRHGEKTHD